MAYTEVVINGYNASPPPDDGSSGASNQVSWAGIKTKLGDPLKTAIEAIDDNVASAITSIDATLVTVQANLYAPAGTLMLFQQTAAPTGWTKQTTHNNKALRVVSGTASTGGTTAFTSVFASRTILQANIPLYNLSASLSVTASGTTSTTGSHNHSYTKPDTPGGNFSGGGGTSVVRGTGSANTGSDGNHAHTVTVSGTASGNISSGGSGTAMDFDVQYVDIILAAKA